MAEIFNSARLTYRAIENNDEDTAFLHSLRLKSSSRASGEPWLLKPIKTADSEKRITRYRDEDFLGVIICLRNQSGEAEGKTMESVMGKPIGRISLKGCKQGEEHHRTADIGINIADEYQWLGYGTEAINWILGWGFKYGWLAPHWFGLFLIQYGSTTVV